MSGFFGLINLKHTPIDGFPSSNDKCSILKGRNYYIRKNFLGKFSNDEILFENDHAIVCLNGVLLNSLSTIKRHKAVNIGEALIKEYQAGGKAMLKGLRGSFSGVLYDKLHDKWIIFTNHFGDKQVFYSSFNDTLIFGSKVSDITEYFKKNNIPYDVDKQGIGSILTYGFMLDDLTLIDGIKKLPYGCFIEFSENTYKIEQYWDFDNINPIREKTNDILARLDHLFRQAVILEFEKDREYGLQHFCTLSGGLDSRMMYHVAHESGYSPIVNFTYSRGLYTDQKVAQQMSDDLGHSFIFALLNENNFFSRYEELVRLTSGRCTLIGNISGFNSVQHINFSNKGIVHTGQLGDVVVGTFNKVPHHVDVKAFSGAMSKKIYPVAPDMDYDKYLNNERFLMIQRGFNGALQGNLIYQGHSEVCSPFMDIDFFEYCMSIPSSLRYNHMLYVKWIREYHPKAAGYEWEKIKAPLNAPAIRFKNIILPVSNLWHPWSALLPRIGKKAGNLSFLAKRHSMTPAQYWYDKNKGLQAQMDRSIQSSGILDMFDNELKASVIDIFQGRDVITKSHLLTVSEALKFLLAH
jgi:asparagine synthase (glutamine-hydrolysing)